MLKGMRVNGTYLAVVFGDAKHYLLGPGHRNTHKQLCTDRIFP